MAEEIRIRETWRDALRLRRALRLVAQAGRRSLVIALALSMAQGLLPLVTLWVTKLLLDAVVAAVKTPGEGFPWAALGFPLAVALLASLLGEVLRTFGRYFSQIHAQRVSERAQDVLHEHSIRLDLAWYEDPKAHNRLFRAQQEAPHRPYKVVSELFALVTGVIVALATGALLVSFHWLLALAVLVAAIPPVLAEVRLHRKLFDWRRTRTEDERTASYYSSLLSGPLPARELRLFDFGTEILQRYRRLRRLIFDQKNKIMARHSLITGGLEVVGILAYFAAYAAIADAAIAGTISIGALVMYVQGLQRASSSVSGILDNAAGLAESHVFLADFDEFLALSPRVSDPEKPQKFPAQLRSGITFDDVGFSYGAAATPVLSGLSFHVKPGERVAIVGRNGAGKSTMVKLLARLYDPTHGRILIDGHPLTAYAQRDLRKALGVLTQDFGRYDMSAAENIRIGNLDVPEADRGRIVQAALASGAAEVIAKLPKTYDTVLGHRFGEGRDLSLGEWQRLALARVYLRSPEILILDEPSSALDAAAEAELLAHLEGISGSRTTLLISHRLSSVRRMDRVLVIDSGRIAEDGTHDELIAKGGLYAQLFLAQAKPYL